MSEEMDRAEHRRRSYETWQRVARGWEHNREYLQHVARPVAEWMVERLDPRPGQTVLELAAGTGDTGFAAAARLGDTGTLISTDFSPKMVAAARRVGDRLGLRNVEYRVLDAERMDLEADSVDGVLCRWAYMLMADPVSAFRETRRVLRAGGRLCFSVWADPDRNPWAATPAGVLVAHGHAEAPEPGAPGMFSMASPERIRELAAGAGFDPPHIEEVAVSWRFEDFAAYWRFVTELAGGMAVTIAGLEEEDREVVRADLRRQLAPFRVDGGYELPGVSVNAVTE